MREKGFQSLKLELRILKIVLSVQSEAENFSDW
jgi:hypothetical protein